MPPRDLRRVLVDAWERMDSASQERVNEMAEQVWVSALTASKDQMIRGLDLVCPSCGAKKLYDIPFEHADVLTQAKTLEILNTLTWGKPVEERRLTITVSAVDELEGLADEELALIAGAVDAEWAPLELPERVA